MLIIRTYQRPGMWSRIISAFTAFTFLASLVLPPQRASAQIAGSEFLNLPMPGSMVQVSPGFKPAHIKGVNIHPENPLQFDFIIDTGDSGVSGDALRAESLKLIKYFLASLTVPEEEMWVNLSPYEKNRIIPDGFGQTEMGRDLLAQDYLLKQLTSSLMYPEQGLGNEFWKRVYAKAQEQYGTTDIPLNTFHPPVEGETSPNFLNWAGKIWIVPHKATVFEHARGAFIVDAKLKVLLEEDYLAMRSSSEKNTVAGHTLPLQDIIREILLPEIEKEVNEGKNFANLRQIYHAMILATWYKERLKESLLGHVYVDQNKVKGVDIEDKQGKEKIYSQYLEAFKTGVYNYIREDYDPARQEVIPRKYFSGGFDAGDPKHSLRNIFGAAVIAAAAFGIQPAAVQAGIHAVQHLPSVPDAQVVRVTTNLLDFGQSVDIPTLDLASRADNAPVLVQGWDDGRWDAYAANFGNGSSPAALTFKDWSQTPVADYAVLATTEDRAREREAIKIVEKAQRLENFPEARKSILTDAIPERGKRLKELWTRPESVADLIEGDLKKEPKHLPDLTKILSHLDQADFREGYMARWKAEADRDSAMLVSFPMLPESFGQRLLEGYQGLEARVGQILGQAGGWKSEYTAGITSANLRPMSLEDFSALIVKYKGIVVPVIAGVKFVREEKPVMEITYDQGRVSVNIETDDPDVRRALEGEVYAALKRLPPVVRGEGPMGSLRAYARELNKFLEATAAVFQEAVTQLETEGGFSDEQRIRLLILAGDLREEIAARDDDFSLPNLLRRTITKGSFSADGGIEVSGLEWDMVNGIVPFEMELGKTAGRNAALMKVSLKSEMERMARVQAWLDSLQTAAEARVLDLFDGRQALAPPAADRAMLAEVVTKGSVVRNGEDRLVNTAVEIDGVPHRVMGVFDGLGGAAVANLAAKRAVPLFEANFRQLRDYDSALKKTVADLHQEVRALGEAARSVGSTLALTVTAGREVWGAWLGDSRVMIGGRGKDTYITPEHNVRRNLEERSALERAGGVYDPSGGYIQIRSGDGGSVQPSRMLGFTSAEAALNPEPETFHQRLEAGDFVLVYTDGLTEMKNVSTVEDEARQIEAQTARVAEQAQDVNADAVTLVDAAEEFSDDDITAGLYRIVNHPDKISRSVGDKVQPVKERAVIESLLKDWSKYFLTGKGKNEPERTLRRVLTVDPDRVFMSVGKSRQLMLSVSPEGEARPAVFYDDEGNGLYMAKDKQGFILKIPEGVFRIQRTGRAEGLLDFEVARVTTDKAMLVEAMESTDGNFALKREARVILVVEDEPEVRDLAGEIIENYVKPLGDGEAQIIKVSNLAAAKRAAAIAGENLSFVLTDGEYPLESGVDVDNSSPAGAQLINYLRRDLKHPAKVILMSGKPMGDILTSKDEPVDDFLKKPFGLAVLRMALNMYLTFPSDQAMLSEPKERELIEEDVFAAPRPLTIERVEEQYRMLMESSDSEIARLRQTFLDAIAGALKPEAQKRTFAQMADAAREAAVAALIELSALRPSKKNTVEGFTRDDVFGPQFEEPELDITKTDIRGIGAFAAIVKKKMAGPSRNGVARKTTSASSANGSLNGKAPGGIDLNPALLDMQIKRDGQGVPLPMDVQPFEQMRIEGFLPVIIDIKIIPASNLPLIFGGGNEVFQQDDLSLIGNLPRQSSRDPEDLL